MLIIIDLFALIDKILFPKVLLLFLNGDKMLFNNYRTVSVLPFFSKTPFKFQKFK